VGSEGGGPRFPSAFCPLAPPPLSRLHHYAIIYAAISSLNSFFMNAGFDLEERHMGSNIGYLYAAILLAAGFIFVLVATTLENIIAPHSKTKEKLQTYESGETPIGNAWVQYPLGFYIFALLFVAFDVDIVFIVSWAIIFKQLSFFGFFEILFFIIVLALGLAYAWRKGVTRWI
jgi:NADH:ubiquinone oxidoreductase subunit 3 (subunit A)